MQLANATCEDDFYLIAGLRPRLLHRRVDARAHIVPKVARIVNNYGVDLISTPEFVTLELVVHNDGGRPFDYWRFDSSRNDFHYRSFETAQEGFAKPIRAHMRKSIQKICI